MKDIDFDELDKAVNSLMASTPSTAEQASSDSTEPSSTVQQPLQTQPVSPSINLDPTPTPAAAQPTVTSPSQAPTVVPSRQSPPATRRGGRFMDMVSTSASKPMAPTPSRQGVTITPRNEESNFEAPAPQAPTPSAPPSAATMPDPIDLASAQTSTEDVAPAPTSTPIGPIESPFLTDAKVEKRPLNAGPTTDQTNDMSSMLDDQTSAEPVTMLDGVQTNEPEFKKGDDEPMVDPQVPELASDLVAIESDEKVETTQAVESVQAAAEVAQPTEPLGPSSIAQQYKAQPSTGDQSHAAIYDASQYPQPVNHPAKHRSSWWWVLWVILLLGVGAGGAVALYNLGIIP